MGRLLQILFVFLAILSFSLPLEQRAESCPGYSRHLFVPLSVNETPSLSLEPSTRAIDNQNEKVVYWKVTEHGYSRCRINCLLEDAANSAPDDRLNTLYSTLESSNSNSRLSATVWAKSSPLGTKSLTEPVQARGYSDLSCVPFANETEYDFLEAVGNRDSLKNVPEPGLLTTLFAEANIDVDTLHKRLLGINSYSVSSFVVYRINIDFATVA